MIWSAEKWNITGTITPGGSSVTVTTTVRGQNGALTFSGSSGQRISLQGTSGTFWNSAYVNTLNPSGSALFNGYMYGSGLIDVQTLPSTGTYTIVVNRDNTGTGSLTLPPVLFQNSADVVCRFTILPVRITRIRAVGHPLTLARVYGRSFIRSRLTAFLAPPPTADPIAAIRPISVASRNLMAATTASRF